MKGKGGQIIPRIETSGTVGSNKNVAQTMYDASRIALHDDAALFGAGMFRSFDGQSTILTPRKLTICDRRRRDRANNACFSIYKRGRRAYKFFKKDQKRLPLEIIM